MNGAEEETMAKLQEARNFGTLPDRQHLLADRDLANIRDAAWFRDFLDQSFGT